MTTDFWSQVLNLIAWMIFFMFFNRIMVIQIMFKLEKTATMLERMSKRAENLVVKKIKKRPDKRLRDAVRHFMEFFVIEPVSLDPYGIIKKLEHLIDLEKERFKYFVEQVATDLDPEERANIMMGLSSAISLYQITKLMRHYVELIKKTKSFNLAMLLQMQIPLIERTAKALMTGTEALTNGWPIGDTIGAYVVANLIGNSKVKVVDEETVICRKKYKGRNVIIIKAKGPGSRTGNPGRVLERLSKKERIAKIITIDAAAKLEGEKTGSIAEGIGVAIGGIGVEKSYIEKVAVKKRIPLDSIVIKMSQEEAIMPMKKAILNATPRVLRLVEETIERTKEKGKIVIIGVGNTSGVGNSKKEVEESEKIILKVIRKMEARAKRERKRFRLPWPFTF